MTWLVILAVGCAHRAPVDPASSLPFAFSGRPTWGEVRVVPTIALHDPVELNLDSWLGAPLPPARVEVRRDRTRQLILLPEAVGLALPGEINSVLGLSWAGQFHLHDLPTATRDRVADAVSGRRAGLDGVLGEAARVVGGDAALLTWVTELEGVPLSRGGFPGEVQETPVGPVLVDHADEPYLVTAKIGMALVTRDGEVVVRYQDTFETILSGRTGEAGAGRDLARSLAREVTLVWGNDPRLLEYEPVSSVALPPPDASAWDRAAL